MCLRDSGCLSGDEGGTGCVARLGNCSEFSPLEGLMASQDRSMDPVPIEASESPTRSRLSRGSAAASTRRHESDGTGDERDGLPHEWKVHVEAGGA